MPCRKYKIRKHRRRKNGKLIIVNAHKRKVKKKLFRSTDLQRWAREIHEQEKVPKETIFLSTLTDKERKEFTRGNFFD